MKRGEYCRQVTRHIWHESGDLYNAYGYVTQEFGVDVAAVIEPAHGVRQSASQLRN